MRFGRGASRGAAAIIVGATGVFVSCLGLAAAPVPAPQVTPDAAAADPASGEELAGLRDGIRNRVEVVRGAGRGSAAGARLHAVEALPRFYEEEGFEPAWIGPNGIRPGAEELVGFLRQVERDGLASGDYHRAEIDSLFAVVQGPSAASLEPRVDLELLLTDAFLLLGSHLHRGRVNPENIQPEWIANRRGTDMAAVLEEALGGGGVRATLASLRPGYSGYGAMLEALGALRTVAEDGGWGSVPQGERLEEGSEGGRVALLRQRLRASGDLREENAGLSAPDRFGPDLATAVRRFQRRHGLEPDGIVGPRTLAALNVPVEDRIRQLEINMERWRWLPEDLGSRHILVNIADFTVDVVEDGARIMRLRSVVGRAYRQTPVFSDTMTYLVFAPFWHVPPGIAVNDQLPRIRSDPSGYLPSQNMVLLEQGTNRRVDPATVDWEAISGAEFNRRFRIRQDPGPMNALGRVKFMFPNRYNVYLHDTPARELFDRTVRDFSSGCVRVERALDLAEYLLRDNPQWDRARIERAASASAEQTVRLPDPIPIHIQYWTAWVDEDGVLQFREDIYNRDERVLRALAAAAPSL